jgi:hypothetical protein
VAARRYNRGMLDVALPLSSAVAHGELWLEQDGIEHTG